MKSSDTAYTYVRLFDYIASDIDNFTLHGCAIEEPNFFWLIPWSLDYLSRLCISGVRIFQRINSRIMAHALLHLGLVLVPVYAFAQALSNFKQ